MLLVSFDCEICIGILHILVLDKQITVSSNCMFLGVLQVSSNSFSEIHHYVSASKISSCWRYSTNLVKLLFSDMQMNIDVDHSGEGFIVIVNTVIFL